MSGTSIECGGSPDGLPAVRPLVIPVVPEADESLAGLVARSTAANVLGVTRIILDEAGITSNRPGCVGLNVGRLTKRLAAKIGVGEDEILKRTHPRPDGSDDGEIVRWNDFAVRRSDLVTTRRRISPATLETQNHHLQAWTLRPLPYCPISYERLVDKCPACDVPLGWVGARGIGTCEHCRSTVSHPDGETLPEELREGYDLLAGLFATDPGSRERSLAAIAPGLRSLRPLDLIDLAFAAGRSSSVDADPPTRIRLSTVPAIELARIFVTGARMLLDWPDGYRARLASVHEQPIAVQERTIKAVNVFARGTGWTRDIAALIETAAPELRKAGRKSLAEIGSPMVAPVAFIRAAKLKSREFGALRASALFEGAIPTGQIRSSVLVPQPVADAIIDARRSSQRFTVLACALGLPHYVVEQLVAIGAVERTWHESFPLFGDDLRLDTKSCESFLDELTSMASVCPPDAEASTLSWLMTHHAGGEKPWGPALDALRSGRGVFHLAPLRNGRPQGIVSRIRMTRPEFEALGIPPFDTPVDPSFRQDTVPQRDAMEIAQATHAMLADAAAANQVTFTQGPRSTIVVDRAVIGRLAADHVSSAEIAYRLGLHRFSGPTVANIMERHATLKRLPLGWKRDQVREAFGAAFDIKRNGPSNDAAGQADRSDGEERVNASADPKRLRGN